MVEEFVSGFDVPPALLATNVEMTTGLNGGPGLVFLAAIVSWATLPGPGEAALIAAGISAAHHHLDLTSVVAVAWAGASVGGTAGWMVGVKGGRGLLTAHGPLHHARLAVIARVM